MILILALVARHDASAEFPGYDVTAAVGGELCIRSTSY